MTIRTQWGLVGVAWGLPVALIASAVALITSLIVMAASENSDWLDRGFWLSRAAFILVWVATVWLGLRKGERVEKRLRGAEGSRISLVTKRLRWNLFASTVFSAALNFVVWNFIKAVMPFAAAR